MNVVIGCPIEDKQTGVYLVEGFKELGHTVSAIVNGRTDPTIMLGAIDKYHPTFVLITKDPAYEPVIEEMCRKTFVVMWNFDPRPDINMHLATSMKLFLTCPLIFTNEANKLDEYRKIGVKSIHWLPEGIAPNWHKRESLTFKDHLLYDADVAFAGSMAGISYVYAERQKFISRIQADIPNFKLHTNVFNIEHNKMCQCSKVNLGHSAYPEVTLSMSARDYRILGAGGFLLTNHVDGIDTWFEIGKMCDTYKTYEECIEKIQYYLSHEDVRTKMAAHGYVVAHEKHKFSDRIRVIVDKVKEML